VRVVDVDMGSVSGSELQADDYTGAARLVVDAETRVVLGATFVGQDVAEMAHAAAIAVTGRLTVDMLWHAVPSFPTLSEVWLRLLEEYGL
jgi:dihydrolipoamide dehydrogenase